MEYRQMYKRNLPHYQPKNGLLFVTFRLNFAVPAQYINAYHKYRESLEAQLDIKESIKPQQIVLHKKLFDFVDNYYPEIHSEIDLTKPPEIAILLSDILRSLHDEYYALYAFTIMPNHVHILLKPLTVDEKDLSLAEIMHKIKGSSARQINLVLQRQGKLWQREYYDHWVRTDQEMWNVVEYIRQNPVRAKLASDPECWRWTWINPELGRKI
ncbi:MAG: transposase [Candidatus Cloacimonetes bacterium]|nr:transposase [Candidatus Cloacimonadota bacterium]MDY0171733.1 transposase [Candidatus Cloacimonadaceae bacterium]